MAGGIGERIVFVGMSRWGVFDKDRSSVGVSGGVVVGDGELAGGGRLALPLVSIVCWDWFVVGSL